MGLTGLGAVVRWVYFAAGPSFLSHAALSEPLSAYSDHGVGEQLCRVSPASSKGLKSCEGEMCAGQQPFMLGGAHGVWAPEPRSGGLTWAFPECPGFSVSSHKLTGGFSYNHFAIRCSALRRGRLGGGHEHKFQRWRWLRFPLLWQLTLPGYSPERCRSEAGFSTRIQHWCI